MQKPETGLQHLDAAGLRALAQVIDGNSTLLAQVIREIDSREAYDCRDPAELLAAYVRARVRETRLEFLQLHANLYITDVDAESEFLGYLRAALDGLAPDEDDDEDADTFDEDEEEEPDDPDEPEEPDEPDWPWPLTVAAGSNGRGGSPLFEHERSALKMCGYTVGNGGLPQAERVKLLEHFFRNRLPSAVTQVFGDDYGDPGSEARLQKMANVIASNCRNFKKNDLAKYGRAIRDWEFDLGLLRLRYYRAGSFPWPPTDV